MTYSYNAVTFVELPTFSKARDSYLDDDEFSNLQKKLTEAINAETKRKSAS